MKRKAIIAGSIAVIIALFVIFYFYWGSSAPKGQQPLVKLDNSNIATIKEGFNASANDVRLIVLLSPT